MQLTDTEKDLAGLGLFLTTIWHGKQHFTAAMQLANKLGVLNEFATHSTNPDRITHRTFHQYKILIFEAGKPDHAECGMSNRDTAVKTAIALFSQACTRQVQVWDSLAGDIVPGATDAPGLIYNALIPT